jgi:hypothetical protein
MILNDGGDDIPSSTVSSLARLDDYSEFIAVCCLDVTNVSMKANFGRLRFLHLPSWLTTVSLSIDVIQIRLMQV